VIVPKRNEKDLDEVPKHVRRGMEFVFAETMDDVLPAALRFSAGSKAHRPVAQKVRREKILAPAISARRRG
jgi:ATP-dependent Lon protease